jgi:hemerythrin-like domain-containing protein
MESVECGKRRRNMSQAIDTLMNEHRLIEKVLGSLAAFADALEKGAAAERKTVAEYADFFRNFADKCHHGKEEDRLFVKMIEHGFPKDAGPLAVMYADHEHGREDVAALAAIGAGTGPLTKPERDHVVQLARSFVPHLAHHILKEDNILYPMALQAIPGAEVVQLAADFGAFEKSVMGEGSHERFHALAKSLLAAYPPRPIG